MVGGTIQRRLAWLALGATVAIACSLNPQPLPPETAFDDGGAGGNTDSGLFNASDSGTSPDSSTSTKDGAPSGDAGDASDAPSDAPSDAELEGGG